MSQVKLLNLVLIVVLLTGTTKAQVCMTDSNYYSIHYNTQNNLLFTNGIITPQNEVVALCQNASLSSSFLAKFTAQGNVIWSNEYLPDYPYVNWLDFPWYTNTQMTGILPSRDSSYFIYGSSTEHGKLVNNSEDPPAHQVGLLLDIDKFGKLIAARYFGDWRTNYSVSAVTHLSNGGFVVYLRSHMSPYRSKIVCIDKDGNMAWGIPLQPLELYHEVDDADPLMKQMSNGNLVIMSQVGRTIDDTIFYPFTPPIYLRAPLYFINIIIIDPKDGTVISHQSSECPSLVNTNVDGNFIPRIKSIAELPGGSLSFCLDMYWPTDKVVFYKQKVFSKRAVNFITNAFGQYTGVFSYATENSSCSLESVWQTGNQGQQVLLLKDSTNKQLILTGIDNTGRVEWTKAYSNPVPTNNSTGVLLQKKNSLGYSIAQSDPSLKSFDLLITNAIGNSACSEIPGVKIIVGAEGWQWPPDKVQYWPSDFDLDFRYAGFKMVQKPVPMSQDIYCKYQYECCKDVIDTLNPHNVSVCEGQSYRLPDSTVVTTEGSYYQTLKTTRGCDSVIFYNLKIIKSPSHLKAPPDTCLNSAGTILLNATGGYETYLWNNQVTSNSSYAVETPGVYSVKVTNLCGSKSDTVQVYDKCDFPIYFPNAFTPNGDYLNDVLKVPWANNNKLIKLRIYNRYGQLIFSTTRSSEGWDGTYKGIPQSVGAYTYILEMKGLSGNKQGQKGTVLLLR
ncbi:MAG: gliding motility-associated C-terminal domain-containing protein [Ginsengibacter sp.]